MREIEVRAKGVSEGISGGFEEQIEEVAAFAKGIFGMVKTNWRWGTGWHTDWAIHAPVWRVRRW
jgi:hypothetical protein